MAVSVTNALSVPYRISGNQRKTVNDVTFDNSYLENGEPLTQKELGLSKIEYASCTMLNGSEEATVRASSPYYTPSTELIHLIDNATGKEVASTKDMSKVKVRVEAYGW